MRIMITISLGWFVFREIFNIIKNGYDKKLPNILGSIIAFGLGIISLVFIWYI